MSVERHNLAVTTDASGNATVRTPPMSGFLEYVVYTPDGTNPLATGADITITGDQSGAAFVTHNDIGTSAFTKAYRQAQSNADGSASLYAAAGSAVVGKFAIGGEALKLAVASGGNTKSGTFTFVVSH